LPAEHTVSAAARTLHRMGVTLALNDEPNFRPADPLTREELANWLVRTKQFLAPAKWRVVWPERPHYADVPRDRPGYAEIETLYAHRIDSRLWSGAPLFGDDGLLFHPEASVTRADFAQALFLAARDISPLFAELPGEAVLRRP